MKRPIVTLMLILLLCGRAWGESSVWKVSKGNSTIYLGGTCHVLRESDYPLPPEFDRAYRASQTLVFETDIAMLQDGAVQQQMLARSRYADGSTIEKHLSGRTYAELSAYCRANGIPLEALGSLKPSMLMVTLTVMELMKLGVTQQGVDTHFHRLATRDGKDVEGLETVEQQIEYVVTMADGMEDEFVSHSLRDLASLREKFDRLAAAWRRGNLALLNELTVAELARQPALYRKLITERNRNWLALIDSYRKSPRTEFILVGVAHLAGPDGIIHSLRKRGYRVEQL